MDMKDSDILEIVSSASRPRGHGNKVESVTAGLGIVVIVNHAVPLDFIRSEKGGVGTDLGRYKYRINSELALC